MKSIMSQTSRKTENTILHQLLTALVFLASFALLFLFLFFITRGQKTAEVDVRTAAEMLKNEMDQTKLQAEDELTLRARYGLENTDYDEMVYYGPVTNMDVEELLVLKLSDSGKLSAVKEAFESRIAYQKSCFDGYGTDQTGILNRAQFILRGQYACLIVSDHGETAGALMNQFLRKGVQDGIQ